MRIEPTTTNFFPDIMSPKSSDGYGLSQQSHVPSKMRNMQQHGNELDRLLNLLNVRKSPSPVKTEREILKK